MPITTRWSGCLGLPFNRIPCQCFGASNQWSELPDGWSRHLEEACRWHFLKF